MKNGQCNDFWVGLDVAKLRFEAAVAPEGTRPDAWATIRTKSFAMTAKGARDFSRWIAGRGGACRGIVAESTGIYSLRLAKLLEPALAQPVAIVNPKRPLDFARSLGVREKTDPVDAAIIALYGLLYEPHSRRPLSPAHQQLRDLVRLREDYVRERTAWRNRLGQAEAPAVKREIRSSLRHFETKVKRMEAQIAAHVRAQDVLAGDARLLQSIPGLGPVTTWTLLAELGDLRAYTRGEIVGYAGLFPRRYESGTSVHRRPRMVRGGGARIRTALFMAACALQRARGPLSRHTSRLVERGKAKMQAIGATMRKLLLVARAVLIAGQPFDPEKVGTAEKP